MIIFQDKSIGNLMPLNICLTKFLTVQNKVVYKFSKTNFLFVHGVRSPNEFIVRDVNGL